MLQNNQPDNREAQMEQDNQSEMSQEEHQRKEAEEQLRQQILSKAAGAGELLKHPVLEQFFEDFEYAIKHAMWHADTGDTDKLKTLSEQAGACKLLRTTLEGYVMKGELVIQAQKEDNAPTQ
jgi:hypothetical protein